MSKQNIQEDFGTIIRKLREDRKLPLRTVAACIDIDQAILSKIERGLRKPSRTQVVKLAAYFKVNEKNLLLPWLAEKIMQEAGNDELALEALQLAEDRVAYNTYQNKEKKPFKKILARYFKSDGRIEKAWLFGSVARGEDDYKSDVDVMIELPPDSTFSLFDLADVQYKLEQLLVQKVDIVTRDAVKPPVMERIKPDLQLVYER